jgi:uncharacterized lipoprotein YajG
VRRAAPLAAALVLAGCAGPPEHEHAVDAVARASGTERVQCTSNARLWFKEQRVKVFLCLVRREHGVCERWRVERNGNRYRARLELERAECTLPAG